MRHLIEDLKEWKTLYVSGRMQKPIIILENKIDAAAFDQAQQNNLKSAFLVALLTLPESFEEYELFHAISNISYSGDIRTKVGAEQKNKVSNIVTANLEQFRIIYKIEPVKRK